METHNALKKIRQIKQRYILYNLFGDAFNAATISLVIYVLLHILFLSSVWYVLPFFAVMFTALVLYKQQWRVSDTAIITFLDITYPQLEESSGIILIPATNLNLLQKLQLYKVTQALSQIPSQHQQTTKKLRIWLILFLCAAILLIATRHLHFNPANIKNDFFKQNQPSPASIIPEKKLPEIAEINIKVISPAYTHHGEKSQDKFTLDVDEGALVIWNLKTNVSAGKVSLLFDEKEETVLRSDNNHTTWVAQKLLTKAGFYQVVVDGKRSDLYQIQVIKDTPPVIQIKTPKQYTYIDAGEKPEITINVNITDDYGVSDACINATIAKGSGEGVKFKEQKINFNGAFNGDQRSYSLKKTIQLSSLNMEPGDELYFYVQAKDNHQQISHTDIYIVSIQDTAQLLSMDGIVSGVNIKPEYFRSERQIILDSETLLKEKDTISEDEFKNRSNDLGTDQKLLRLRYGKFLGEEAENEIGDPRVAGNKEESLADPKDFGNGAKILDEYTDKHDNAEDAQFFDPTVKAQLKATLTEMWKAELQLRLYKPQDGLPFEYKALRLLKDLQQKSRSYVAKTAYNPSPLKMDKRLTGDLSKVIQPTNHVDIKVNQDQYIALKQSIYILDKLKNNKGLNAGEYHILQTANLQLSNRAASQPATYLIAASAMRRILNNNKTNNETDVLVIEKAIQKILPVNQSLPQNGLSSPDMGLSQAYYLKLNSSAR